MTEVFYTLFFFNIFGKVLHFSSKLYQTKERSLTLGEKYKNILHTHFFFLNKTTEEEKKKKRFCYIILSGFVETVQSLYTDRAGEWCIVGF